MPSFQATAASAAALLLLLLPADAFIVPRAASSSASTALRAATSSSVTTSTPAAAVGGSSSDAHFMDYLKFDGKPTFDVIEKTKDYLFTQIETGVLASPDIYSDEFVLRGPIIGPIGLKDLRETQGKFKATDAFPDLDTSPFGFCIDPQNPYKCLWFERWTGTHTGVFFPGVFDVQPTGNRMETPLVTNYMVWNPEGKIVYQSVGNVVDRHEGNTKGKGAFFGMFETVGMNVPASVGDPVLRVLQRMGHLMPGNKTGRAFSRDEDIPSWWKSKSRGADPNDPEASG